MATVVDNVQEDIDAETERLRQPRAFTAAEWFSDYHPYADIKTYFSQLAARESFSLLSFYVISLAWHAKFGRC
jgi:hypothetical protein